MTIAQLVVEIEARNRSLKSVLSDSTRGVNAFVREVENANKKIAAMPSPLDRWGNETPQGRSIAQARVAQARELSDEIIKGYKAADKALRKLLTTGTISNEEFAARGRALAEATVKGAREKFAQFQGALGTDATNALVGSLETGLAKASAAAEKGARNINQLQKALNELDATRDRALGELDRAIGEGRVSAAERTLRRAEIIAQRNEALIRKVNEMEAAGQMRPALREAALSKLDPRGFGFGISRTEAERAFQDAERQIGSLQKRMQSSIAKTKLDLAAGLDPRIGEQRIAAAYQAMNQGIQHGRTRLEQAKLLTPEIERLLSGSLVKVPKVKPDLSPVEQSFLDVQRQVGRLRERMQTDIARTKLDLLAGLDPKIGEQRIAAAYEAMNRGLAHGRARLESAKLLTPEIERFLSGQVVRAPKASAPVNEAFSAAERQIKLLQDQMQSVISRTKIDVAAGLDPQLAQRRIVAANQALNRGLADMRASIVRTAGTITPEIENLIAGAVVKVPKIRPQEIEQTIRQVSLLRQRMEAEIAKTKLDVAMGLDPRIAERRIAAAYDAMNRGILHGRERLRRAGSLTADVEQILSKSLVKVPIVKPDLTQAERTFADVQRQVGRLQARMKAEVDRTKLDVAAGLDPRIAERRVIAAYEAMNRGIQHGRARLAQAKLLTPEIEGVLAGGLVKVPQAKLNLTPVEENFRNAQRQIKRLQGNLQQEVGRAKLDFAAGFIDTGALNRRIDAAFQTMQRGIEHGRSRLRAGSALTGQIEAEMSSALDAAGRVVSRARAKVVDEGAKLAKEGVTKFRDAYNASIGLAKLRTTTGELDTKGFVKAANDAKAAFNKELGRLRRDLEDQGLLTPSAARLIDRQFQKAGADAAKGFVAALQKASADPVVQQLNALGQSATRVGRTLTVGLSVPLAGVGAASVKLAGDAEQAQRRLEQMFGPLSANLDRELLALQKSVPATSGELRQMAARFGELLIPLGIAPAEIAKMSKELIIASKNIGVFAGVNSERSMNAVINALIGQSRELKKLGIEIDDITIRDEVYRLGLARVGAQLSTTQKVLGAYNIILSRSRVVASTLEDQQNTFNVRLIFFQKALKETGITIGSQMLPMLTALVQRAADAVNAFQGLSEGTRKFILVIAGVAIVLGPALVALGTFLKTIASLRVAYLTLQAVTASAGAAAGGGAFAALLGITGGTAALILTVVGAVGLLSLGMRDLGQRMGDFQGLSAQFIRRLKEMTGAELEGELKARRAQELRISSERFKLMKRSGITELPGGFLAGGTIAQRQEFVRLGEQLKAIRAESQAISEEWTNLDLQQIRLNKSAADWEKRIKETQDLSNQKLLAESLREATREYSLLTAEAAKSRSAIRAGIKSHDPELLSQGIEGAQATLGKVTSLIQKFQDMQKDPELGPLGKEFDRLINRTKALENSLKGLVSTTAKSTELVGFARDVRVAIAELANDQGAGRDISESLARVNDLAEQTAKRMRAIGVTDEALDRLRIMAVQLETAARNAAKVDISGLTSRVALEMESLRDLTERSKDATGGERAQVTQDLFTQLVRVAAVEREINDMIALGVGTAKQRNTLQERLIELKRAEVNANRTILDSVDIFLPGLREQLQEQANRLKGAQATLDVQLRIPRNEEAIRQAKQAISRIQEEIGRSVQGAMGGGLFKALDQGQQAEVLRVLDSLMKDLGIDGQTFNEELEKTDKILDRISIGIRGIGEIFEAFGVESQNARELVRNANLAVQAFKQIRAAQEARQNRRDREIQTNPFAASKQFDFSEIVGLVSGVAGTVGAVVGLIGSIRSLFGKSEREKEHDAILEKNNERLAELRSEISKFTLSIGNQARVQRAISDPNVRRAIETRRFIESQPAFFGAGARGKAREDLERELQRFGLSMADINRIAKENGITLLDSKGRLVAGAFDQLVEAIGISRAAFFQYSDTLADLTTKTDLFNDVFNVEDTGQQQIQDQLGFLERLAPDLFKQFFAGIDLSDATAVEAALQSLTRALLDGTLATSETLKLLDKGELERIITGVAGGLDKLRDATDNMTESMLNVPEWFKTNQVRFESVGPIDSPTLPPRTSPQSGEPGPFTPTVPGPPGGVRPTASQTISVGGDIVFHITQQPGEDAEELARRVVDVWRTENFLRTGESTTPLDN